MPVLEHQVLASLCQLLHKTQGSASPFVLAYTFGPSLLRSERKATDLVAATNANAFATAATPNAAKADADLKALKTELVVNPRLVNSLLTMLIKYHAAVFNSDMRVVELEEEGAAAALGGATTVDGTAPVVTLQDRITAVTRARLIKVYSEKNPSKLSHVDQLCYKYRGKEREMLQVCLCGYRCVCGYVFVCVCVCVPGCACGCACVWVSGARFGSPCVGPARFSTRWPSPMNRHVVVRLSRRS
jgi:hypothetical protein